MGDFEVKYYFEGMYSCGKSKVEFWAMDCVGLEGLSSKD